MTPDLFKRCLTALYGRYYVSPAAQELEVRIDRIQRMAAGDERIYPQTAAKIIELLRARYGETHELLRDLDGRKIDG